MDKKEMLERLDTLRLWHMGERHLLEHGQEHEVVELIVAVVKELDKPIVKVEEPISYVTGSCTIDQAVSASWAPHTPIPHIINDDGKAEIVVSTRPMKRQPLQKVRRKLNNSNYYFCRRCIEVINGSELHVLECPTCGTSDLKVIDTQREDWLAELEEKAEKVEAKYEKIINEDPVSEFGLKNNIGVGTSIPMTPYSERYGIEE